MTWLHHLLRIIRAYWFMWRVAPTAHGHRHQAGVLTCASCLNTIPFWARADVYDHEHANGKHP